MIQQGIYQILCTITNKGYIGSSVNISKRCNQHKHLLRKNNHTNRYLQNAWNKYGEEAFEFKIIYISKTRDYLTKLEGWFISKSNISSEMNLKKYAHDKFVVSEETKKKISRKNIGRKLSQYHRDIIRTAITDKWKNNNVFIEKCSRNLKHTKCGYENINSKLTEENVIEIINHLNSGTRVRKISEMFCVTNPLIYDIKNKKIWKHLSYLLIDNLPRPKRQGLTEEHKANISKGNVGKKMSQENKDKLSVLKYGRKLSDETKRKLSEINKEKHRNKLLNKGEALCHVVV